MSIVLPNETASEHSHTSDNDECALPGSTSVPRLRPTDRQAHADDDEDDFDDDFDGDDVSEPYDDDELPDSSSSGRPLLICPHCDQGFKQRDRLDRHVAGHTGIRRFRCTVNALCERTYTCRAHLLRHVRVKHSDWRPTGDSHEASLLLAGFSCPQPDCPRRLKTHKGLLLHVRQHEGERRYGCADCPKAFSHKWQLHRHSFQHTGVKPFVCERCSMGFTRRYRLTRHNCSQQRSCPRCAQTFAGDAALNAHLKLEHRLQCPQCDSTFRFKATLSGHLRSEHGADNTLKPVVKCAEPSCPRRFTYQRNMQAHWNVAHSAEKRFVCERCQQSMSNKRSLDNHMDWHRRHPDAVVSERPKASLACHVDGCDRVYVRMQALVVHLREKHPGAEIPRAPANRTRAQRLAAVRDTSEEESDEGAGEVTKDGDESANEAGQAADAVAADSLADGTSVSAAQPAANEAGQAADAVADDSLADGSSDSAAQPAIAADASAPFDVEKSISEVFQMLVESDDYLADEPFVHPAKKIKV